MENMILPVSVLGGLGLLFGVLLSVASKVFAVEVDPKISAVLDALPGANCGACGFPGCEGLATAIAEGKAPVNSCPIGGQKVADNVADIMGLNAGNMERKVAVVLCQGSKEKAKDKYKYEGIQDCRIQGQLADGCKYCNYGCSGCGTCFDVCDFDAIRMVDGVAVIDKEKCTACMKCIKVCPKHIIELVPYDNEYIVKCKSEDKGKEVRGNCSIGCIGCKICVKNCPVDAFTFENNLAKINYDKCTNCGICQEKCPTKCIYTSNEKVVVN
ncbi:RnfABCDGE type electron transport complex subunit B [Wansuia hejianensis]|uniref:Ion-translocating oxidoreductase complex subunit B n=1 Tax=Wansuia hejianensis TaxID=2763667 RepID=A0A926EXL7_9FIRM|nr:RnfABCDGE type electron transport complex subunit B [Wansuia hejianensis]MBC8590831.1 RnfABCDGE type electron transport complex subunit B [Wansuia hejianensis]